MAQALAALVLAVVVLTEPAAARGCPEGDGPFPVHHRDAAPFRDAIAAEAGRPASAARLTGITVPHHLAAAHLIARGFHAASGFSYDRVIVISPDHFMRSAKPFATTTRGFETVLGPVAADAEGAAALLRHPALVEESCLFGREHGVRALMPFLNKALPGARVLPVAISLRARPADWDLLAGILAPLVGERTLVVQSTDFSHYLPHALARMHDQQTLNLLAAGEPSALHALRQPGHLDSLGAMHVQLALQARLHGARPLVVASENQQQYTGADLAETTSYMVILFTRPPDEEAALLAHDDAAEIVLFAGDTHFGRAMTPLLADPDRAERLRAEVIAVTRGRPLVVNLEGVLLPQVPAGLPHLTIAMPEDLAVDWLQALGVRAVGLANNHVMDLGPNGLAESVRALDAVGIEHFGQGEALDLGPFVVVGLTDLDSTGRPQLDLVTPELLDRLSLAGNQKPVVAFVHWGREYVDRPSPREQMLAEEMRLRGVSAIVGAHPHVASRGLDALSGGDVLQVYSLGNFLFDQTAAVSSGAMLELRVFPQGTFFGRLVPLPDFFDRARRR